MVLVRFPQEGSGGGFDSLEENFNLKEDVDVFSIEVDSKPCIEKFCEGE